MPSRLALRRKRSGHAYRVARRVMFARYGTVCVACGHDGAREAGHVEALANEPNQPIDPDLMRPMHGTSCRCPTCGRACNQEQGTQSLASMFKPRLPW